MGKVKKVGLAAAGFYAIDKIPTGGGSSSGKNPLVPSSSTTRPTRPAGQYPKGGGKGLKLGPNINVGAGGSTTSYTVKKGDTLSAIAKTSGVKLSEVLAANPKIADKKSKYKGGNMIWSGTKVKIPTKK
jgi:LysM repeat protein